MLISFKNKKIRAICEDEIIAIQYLGGEVALKLQSRLADLTAAKCVNDIIAGNPSEVLNTPFPNYKIDLLNNYIIIFAANNVELPLLHKGIDWTKVNRIKILEINKDNG